MSNIGNNIKKIRMGKWMKKVTLAEYMDLTLQQIDDIEDGLTTPDSTMILKFCNALNCSLNSLMNKHTVKLKTKEICKLPYI